MRLRKFFNIRTVAALLVLCSLTVSNSVTYAQQDSTVISTTAAIDTAAKTAVSALAPSAIPLISTAVDTVARYKNMEPIAVVKDFSAAHKTAAYYTLLFF